MSHPPEFATFLDAGRYLRGWSDRTVRTYTQGLATLGATPLTKAGLASWVRSMRDRGLTPGGINMYARSVNSFLTWAHDEGLVSERLRVRLLPDPPKPLTPITDAEIRRLVVFRPRGRLQVRTWTLIVLLADGSVDGCHTGSQDVSDPQRRAREHLRVPDRGRSRPGGGPEVRIPGGTKRRPAMRRHGRAPVRKCKHAWR